MRLACLQAAAMLGLQKQETLAIAAEYFNFVSDAKNRRNRRLGDYEVGYCRPPAQTQFKQGNSGNPRGRPGKRARIKRTASRR
jgi:hypothetical protein